MAIKVIDKNGVSYSCDSGVVTLKEGELITQKLIDQGLFSEGGLTNLQENKRIEGFEPSKEYLKQLDKEAKVLEASRLKGEEIASKREDYKAGRLERQAAQQAARELKIKTGVKPDKEMPDADIDDEEAIKLAAKAAAKEAKKQAKAAAKALKKNK